MTKIIILPDETLDEYYERTLQYLRAKYHSYPTNLKPGDSSNTPFSPKVENGGKSEKPDHMKVR